MFTLLAVLALVLVLVTGIILLGVFDPLPKAAQAWGKAVVAAPPVVPVTVIDEGARFMDWAVDMRRSEAEAERAMELLWSDGEDEEAERREQHADWVAFRVYQRCVQADADRLGNEYEQAMAARLGWHNHYFDNTDWCNRAERHADDYAARLSARTHRSKTAQAKWSNQPWDKPIISKLNFEIIRTGHMYSPQLDRWLTDGERVVEHTLHVYNFERDQHRAPQSHHTKHVNPHKGQARMGELRAQLEQAEIDAQEQAQAIEDLINALLHRS